MGERTLDVRVLFLAPQPFYQLRGMCIAQKRCLEVLGAMGLEIDLLTFPYGENVETARLRILRLPRLPFVASVPIGPSWRKLALDALLFLRAAWLCLTRRYAVVHACEEAAVLASVLKLCFRFKLVYDMDDILSRRVASSGFLKSRTILTCLEGLESWAIRSADLVFTNSRETTEYAATIAASADKVLLYDHLPPVPARRRLSPAHRQRVRDKIGLDHQKVIVYAGNLEAYQGVDLLMDSLPQVVRTSPRVCCVIIGGKSDQIEALRGRCEDLGIAQVVRWLGQRPLEETFRFMQVADVLVSPMTQEKAVPMKLYAYLAAGVPIVATDLPNHTQLLDEKTAVLVPPRPAALAEAILGVISAGTPIPGRAARPPQPRLRASNDASVLREAYELLLLRARGTLPVPRSPRAHR